MAGQDCWRAVAPSPSNRETVSPASLLEMVTKYASVLLRCRLAQSLQLLPPLLPAQWD